MAMVGHFGFGSDWYQMVKVDDMVCVASTTATVTATVFGPDVVADMYCMALVLAEHPV
jgi:hypothetical protein